MDHHGRVRLQQELSRPKGMIDDLHQNHFHLMISVWPFFDPGTRDLRRDGQARILHRPDEGERISSGGHGALRRVQSGGARSITGT